MDRGNPFPIGHTWILRDKQPWEPTFPLFFGGYFPMCLRRMSAWMSAGQLLVGAPSFLNFRVMTLEKVY